ncbi:adenosylcobinamide-phosphate synthase CbiB [Aquisediminimonas sediminicola]|uniref:adenosylcobinamide-phosphate synthase CbiB n=1 Tax=Alteraquisediminimonas sediminicola TaxID=2676787 RepID=UPI001C8D3800|nr:adenosylcobinamide-phosphate synthase CbiB [Aquisediminimonas sediminicola]
MNGDIIIGDRAAQLLAVLMLEAAFGYPRLALQWIGHPVIWVGALLARLDRQWNIAGWRRAKGVGVVLILIALGGGMGWAIDAMAQGPIGAVTIILFATIGLAQRSLYDHVAAVIRPLTTGDLPMARAALSHIVGRDTDDLDAQSIAAGATETLAESLCDGIVAPAFWFLLLGLPGLFIFKCISTADSMIGHKDARHGEFGWAAARLDDLLNWVPARLSGLLICIAGGRDSWRIMWRDAHRHLSPNAGWPESAMAGALALQLGGGASYASDWIARQTLGDGLRPTPADLQRAMIIFRRACGLLWLITGVIAWPL